MECREKECVDENEVPKRYYELAIIGGESVQSLKRFLEKLMLSYARMVDVHTDREGHRHDGPIVQSNGWRLLTDQYLLDIPRRNFRVVSEFHPPWVGMYWIVGEDADKKSNRLLLQKLRDRMEDALRFV